MVSVRRVVAWMSLVSALCCPLLAVAADDAATPEEVVARVWQAAKYLHDKGASGIADFNGRDPRWVWKDSYVFVYDCRMDRMVAHPMRPDLVGRPLLQVTDNNGKAIFKDLCKAGTGPRGGWVEYLWTKPGAGRVSRKLSYAVTADMAFSSGIQVAAGVYDEKMSVADLSRMLEAMADPAKYPAH